MKLNKTDSFKINCNDKSSKYRNNQAWTNQYYSRHGKSLILSECIEIKEGFFKRCFYAIVIVLRHINIKLNK